MDPRDYIDNDEGRDEREYCEVCDSGHYAPMCEPEPEQAALHCPDCGSDALEFRLSGNGPLDEQTEVAFCHQCGSECDARDTKGKIVDPRIPRIEAKPVKLVKTAQGDLFKGEVA